MERKTRRLSKKSYYASRIKKIARLLFYRRHTIPGAKGWELRRRVGSDYPKIIKLLDEYLNKIGLTVKIVFKESSPPENPTLEQYDKARFYVTLRDNLTTDEAKLVGWRIDDLAALCASIAYIISKGGKARRKELEKLLENKIPSWRVDINLNRFVRLGYLIEDDNEQIYLGWRTRAEVDQKKLIDLLLEAEAST
ncbi:hypothetical protein J7L29_08465 [Candidatus Bathyarchaeota archaeon]|nr:hypothetical protein [Candidatus Bathyarchaeota archaeon]